MKILEYLEYFKNINKKESSAKIAKERLQIIVAHQNKKDNHACEFLPKLEKEILQVIAKYIPVEKQEEVKVELEHNNDLSVMELNITLPN